MHYLTLGFQGINDTLVEFNLDLGLDMWIEEMTLSDSPNTFKIPFEDDCEITLAVFSPNDEYLLWRHVFNSLSLDFFIGENGKIQMLVI